MRLVRLRTLFLSLRVRFIAIVGLTIAICLVAATLITLKLHYQQLIETKMEKAEVLLKTISQLFTRGPQPFPHSGLQMIFQTMGTHSDIRSVRLIGARDEILLSSHPSEVGIRFIIENPKSGSLSSNGDSSYGVVDEGIIQRGKVLESGEVERNIMAIVQRPRDERWAFLPQMIPGRAHRHPRTFSSTTLLYDEARCGSCHQKPVDARLNIGISLEEMNESLQMVGSRLLMWALVTTVLAGVIISLLFSKLVNSPLAQLIKTMRTVEEGDMRARTSLKRKDEIGQLGEKFDAMVERLGVAQEEIQRYHEEQMEQASRMASVGEMASALAHEIRNPLAGISGAAQIIRRDLSPGEPRYKVLTEILGQVDRLARAVSNIIRYAKSQPLRLESVLLRDITAEALASFEAQLEERRIDVSVSEEDDLGPIRVDPGQMQQVFMNLILNACKSMPEGGELRIRIKSGKERNKDVQTLEFEDTGPSLSPERLEEVFKPFYTKKSGDTGLGLSVAQKIVSRHGGKMTAISPPGKGTVYAVTLPFDGPNMTAGSRAESHAPSAKAVDA